MLLLLDSRHNSFDINIHLGWYCPSLHSWSLVGHGTSFLILTRARQVISLSLDITCSEITMAATFVFLGGFITISFNRFLSIYWNTILGWYCSSLHSWGLVGHGTSFLIRKVISIIFSSSVYHSILRVEK